MKCNRFCTYSAALLLACCGLSSFGATHTENASRSFHVAHLWQIGEAGGWGTMALDSGRHQLYIPRADRIMVVDPTSGRVLAQIPGFQSARAVVLDPEGQHGYAADLTDGTTGMVRVFDRATGKVTASVPVGMDPIALAYDAATHTVAAVNSGSRSVTIVNPVTQRVLATVPLAGRPRAAAASSDGTLYISLPAVAAVVAVDLHTHTIAKTFATGPCSGPGALALDAQHGTLAIGCENSSLASLSLALGSIANAGALPAGTGDLAFDGDLLFAASNMGALTILQRDSTGTYCDLQTVPTATGANRMLLDANTGTAYLAAATYGANMGNVSEELRYKPTAVAGSFTLMAVSR